MTVSLEDATNMPCDPPCVLTARGSFFPLAANGAVNSEGQNNFLAALSAGLDALGLDPRRLLGAGYDGVASDPKPRASFVGAAPPAGSAPMEALEALWVAAEARGAGPAVAVRVANAVPVGAWGPIGYLAGTSTRVDAALLSVQAHLRFVTERAVVDLSQNGVVRLLPAGPGPMSPRLAEFTLAAIAAGFRMGLGRSLPLSEVRLRRAISPSDVPVFEAAFSARVLASAAEDAMTLAQGALELPLGTADPLLQKALRDLVDRLSLGPPAADLELAVRARLRDALREGDASLGVMAARLGMSERTLERRLAALGRSYRDIVDDHRRREAYRLLDAGHLSLAEIALHLGYAEQSAFTRSFRRWAGCSPRAYRAR